MTDEPFIAEICSRPADDGPRLVYCDWLEEQGEADHAEFIRVSIEAARLDPATFVGDALAKQLDLDERVYDLLERGLCSWTPLSWHQGSGVGIRLLNQVEVEFTGSFIQACEFRRGFIESITCDWPTCRDHLDTLRTVQPITRVTLTSMPNATFSPVETDTNNTTEMTVVTKSWLVRIGNDFPQRVMSQHCFSKIALARTPIIEEVVRERMDREIAKSRTPLGYCRTRWKGIDFTLPTVTLPYPPPSLLPPLSQSEMESNVDAYQETRRRIIESFRVPADILRPA